MVVGRRGEVELREDARHVLFDGAQCDEHPVRDRLIRATLGDQLHHLSLARGERIEGIIGTSPSEELAHDVGVERRASFTHAAYSRGELLEIRDPVLQQVTDAVRAVFEQPDRICGLDVLGEDEDAGVGEALADRPRGTTA